MNPSRPQPQKITPALATAAAEALGGLPTRPPAVPTQPVAMVPESPELAARREAFTNFQRGSQPQPHAVENLAIGHPTFDAPADEVMIRRNQVAAIRSRLGNLARTILAENAELQPLISALDSEVVKTAEAFDAAVARDFLAKLSQTVQALSAPSAPVTPAKD